MSLNKDSPRGNVSKLTFLCTKRLHVTSKCTKTTSKISLWFGLVPFVLFDKARVQCFGASCCNVRSPSCTFFSVTHTRCNQRRHSNVTHLVGRGGCVTKWRDESVATVAFWSKIATKRTEFHVLCPNLRITFVQLLCTPNSPHDTLPQYDAFSSVNTLVPWSCTVRGAKRLYPAIYSFTPQYGCHNARVTFITIFIQFPATILVSSSKARFTSRHFTLCEPISQLIVPKFFTRPFSGVNLCVHVRYISNSQWCRELPVYLFPQVSVTAHEYHAIMFSFVLVNVGCVNNADCDGARICRGSGGSAICRSALMFWCYECTVWSFGFHVVSRGDTMNLCALLIVYVPVTHSAKRACQILRLRMCCFIHFGCCLERAPPAWDHTSINSMCSADPQCPTIIFFLTCYFHIYPSHTFWCVLFFIRISLPLEIFVAS